MISLPDFREKQILCINTLSDSNGASAIQFSNDNIVFLKDDKVVNRASCHKVFVVFIVGNISITSRIIKEGLSHGISFFLMKQNFETYAEIPARAEGNYLLRMKQYSFNKEFDILVSKKLMKNKIENQLSLLKSRDLIKSLDEIKNPIFKQIDEVKNNQELLGIEGNMSRRFYSMYFAGIGWYRRMPRVKPDAINVLMDMGYTYLFNFVDSILRLHGFDTYKGHYHKLFFQRKSLSCDIMEPFRCIIDKQILKSYNLKQVNLKDFKAVNKKCALDFQHGKKYSEIFFEAIMENKEEIFSFVQKFYRFVMDQKNEFPYFKVIC